MLQLDCLTLPFQKWAGACSGCVWRVIWCFKMSLPVFFSKRTGSNLVRPLEASCSLPRLWIIFQTWLITFRGDKRKNKEDKTTLGMIFWGGPEECHPGSCALMNPSTILLYLGKKPRLLNSTLVFSGKYLWGTFFWVFFWGAYLQNTS